MSVNALVAFGGIALLGLIAFCCAWFSTRRHEDNPIGPTVYFSGGAVRAEDKLASEFQKLVFLIAVHKAKEAGKMHILKKGERVPKEKLILPQDIEIAFAQATKEIRLSDPKCGACDNKTLADRIRDLQKQYEDKTP